MDNVVLVADADAERCERLLDALDQAGYRCLAAYTGAEALATASRYKPHLAIVRADLPEVQGTDVCLRLKQEDPTGSTAVILLTSSASREERFVAGEVGADLYLTDPIDSEQLIEHVRLIFHQSRLNARARGLPNHTETEAEAAQDALPKKPSTSPVNIAKALADKLDKT
jgi:DNA-binding response OmpR family regulator